MVRSMTGFGKATRMLNGMEISVEVNSVNHRFLDPTVRLPSEWVSLDNLLREALKKRLSRGKIGVFVTRKRGHAGPESVKVDMELAKQYVSAAHTLGSLMGALKELSLDTLVRMDGVFYTEEDPADLDEVQETLLNALNEALDRIDAMRQQEGKALAEDLNHRIDLLRASVAKVEERLPELNRLYEERLRLRIAELRESTGLTEERLALEVAIMAEKGDVTEELVRLKAHFGHADEIFADPEPAGRKLNFLSQEIQREINTLGSKVRDSDVTREVLHMKSELEKFREQIQNIE